MKITNCKQLNITVSTLLILFAAMQMLPAAPFPEEACQQDIFTHDTLQHKHPRPGLTIQEERVATQEEVKEWTFLVYMAADNDLYPFAQRNLAQMCQIGSSENLNIIVHLDIRLPGQPKVTKRLYIQRNQLLQIGPDYCMNSGDAATLINALEWAQDNFPSKHLALVFWNHGSGDLNPSLRRTINPAELFNYNPETDMIELDRSIGFIEFIDKYCASENPSDKQKRGICFDETHKSYLDDTKLIQALSHVHQKRNNKNIDLIIFDACLMAGTGTACIMSKFADYMVASEEVVLGPGYNYHAALEPLAKLKNVQPAAFAHHLVSCYKNTYGSITNDYTHSAFILNKFEPLNQNINTLAELLLEALSKEKNHSVANAIRLSRSRYNCTYFDEPSYIDLGNFYINLFQNIKSITLDNDTDTQTMINCIQTTIRKGLGMLDNFIIANVTGSNLAGAHGLSIYFPEYKMYGPHHASYNSTEFAQHNKWREFLHRYLSI